MKVRYKLSLFLSIFSIIALIILLALWFNILNQAKDQYSFDFKNEVLEFGIELSDLNARQYFNSIDNIQAKTDELSVFEILSEYDANEESHFIVDFRGKLLFDNDVPDQMLELLTPKKLEAAMDRYRISNEVEFTIDNYTKFTETDELILPVRVHYRIEPEEMIILAYGQALYSVFARIHAQDIRNIELGKTYINKGILLSLLILIFSIVGGVLFSQRLITEPVEAIIKGITNVHNGSIHIKTKDEFRTIGETINKLNEQSLELIKKVKVRERQYKRIFQNAEISIWNEDLIGVKLYLDELKKNGVTDLKDFLAENESILLELVRLVKVNQINDATLKLFEADSKELFIKDISTTFGKDAINVFIDELCAIWNNEKVFRSEAVFKTINGKKIFAIISLRIPETLDEFKNIPVCIIDITEKKEAEIALAASQANLHHTRKMEAVGQLAGGMAHDFNNILAAIMNSAELLQLPEHNLDEQSLNYIDMILQVSSRAADLIKKLLAFSRKGNLSKTAINLNNILDDAKTIMTSTLDKKTKIIITKDAQDSIITGDSSSIHNMLLNLCINASNAMSKSGEIRISTRNIKLTQKDCEVSTFDITPGIYCELEVKDNGSGISQENQQKIFEPFFTTNELGKGTGLGLSAVYGTVKDHHGAISVSSEMGIGTTFKILLPCCCEQIIEIPKTKVLKKGSGVILLVDDEELIRKSGMHLLEKLGYCVLTAANGKQALEIFEQRESEIILVLMDMIMPEMNGFDAYKGMKSIRSDCKVVITSGYINNEITDAMKKEGLNGFIGKPFKIDEISSYISKILDD